MLKRHKNPILFRIQQAGLDPKDFHFKKSKDIDNTYHIYYGKSEMMFGFKYELLGNELFSIGYSTFTPQPKWLNHHELQMLTFDKALGHLDEWLNKHLKPYIEEGQLEDLWETLYSVPQKFTTKFEGKDQFTEQEQENLKNRINMLANSI
jgi:hypothetical protein